MECGRNMDDDGLSDEVLDGNQVHVVGHWRKGELCYKVRKNLSELCSCPGVLCKVEIARNKIGYLAEEVFKESVEGVT